MCSRYQIMVGVGRKEKIFTRKIAAAQNENLIFHDTVLMLLQIQRIRPDLRFARSSSHFCWLMYISGGNGARSSSENNGGIFFHQCASISWPSIKIINFLPSSVEPFSTVGFVGNIEIISSGCLNKICQGREGKKERNYKIGATKW